MDFIKEKLFLEEKQPELVCLRPYSLCLRSEYISLAELTRWRALPGDAPAVWATDDIASIAGRGEFLKMLWTAHIMAVKKYACRGGAPKTKYPWEWTMTFPGVRFQTEVAANKEKIPQLPIGDLAASSKGVFAVLIKTWAELREHKANAAQLMVFPGHCAAALKRLGAPCDKITEAQFAVSDPDNVAVERRNVTTLALSDHSFTFGANITEVAAPLDTAVELILEVDERWSMQKIGAEMEKDPRGTMSRMASTLIHKVVEAEAMYQYRENQEKPLRVWSAKILIAAPDGEKLVCASGREALFGRPSVPAMMPSNDLYTIICEKA